ncbi:MAG: uracil-DNA glycosylase [Gemmatimonadota bacterium]|nr:MAG: uracil-DNA glycosylase [Gemmatimonadota bacterium]
MRSSIDPKGCWPVSEETRGELLIRYLKQRIELGQREWYLDGGAADFIARIGALVREVSASPATAGPPTGTTGAGCEGTSVAINAAPRSGNDFEALRTEVLGCTRCRLAEARMTVVFGEGDGEADLLVVGEAPGYEEDLSGRPFVGPAGKLLDKMLAAIGFRRDEVFICNVLKCRPPGNRDPLADEIAACRPYLRKQVEVIAPRVICAFGRFAAQTLLATDQSLTRLRGSTHEFMGVPVVVTYHPAALLRNAEWKRPAWEDLKMLRRLYDDAGGRTPGGERG